MQINTLAHEYRVGIGDFHNFPLQLPHWTYENKLVFTYDAIELVEILDKSNDDQKQDFLNYIPNLSELENFSPDNNPVLVYFKLKRF